MVKPVIEEISCSAPAQETFRRIKDFPHSFFLDSSGGPVKLGRFSFMGCDPFLVFKCKKNSVVLERPDGEDEFFRSDPFSALRDILKRYAISAPDRPEIPFTCGAAGYFGYDLKNFVEDLPDNADDDLDVPDCVLGFYDAAVIYDHLKGKVYIASSGLPETGPIQNARRKKDRLKELKDRISSPARQPSGSGNIYSTSGHGLKSNFSKLAYVEAVGKAKAYIKKGDIYQVNLSQRFESGLNMEPFELYSRLRAFSPAPFSSYLNFGDIIIASSSPERFLFKKGRYIETRPIKGTRPRGADAASDSMMRRELLASSKDRAEHIMIVDLERNDLGRICEYGTVRPVESAALEKYANVFHLVSTVAGTLKEGVDQVDCLLSAFPGGSITGAPKIRSMEIIDELEGLRRSVYTGAIGYLSFDGNMDTSIVIRTFIIKGEKVYFQVGGGIVADSDPEKEYEETLHKAQGLFQALGSSHTSVKSGSGELVGV